MPATMRSLITASVLAASLGAALPALAAPGWRSVPQANVPPARASFGLTFLGGPAPELFLVGGCPTDATCAYGEPSLDDAWTFASGAWTAVNATGAPPFGRFGVAAAGTSDGRAVVFGGAVTKTTSGQGLGKTDDTYLVSPSAGWTKVTGLAPSPRDFAAMTWDPDHGRALLFGGRDGSNGDAGDTWAFTPGQGWLQLSAGGASDPPGRRAGALTYDAVDHQALLFGGDAGGSSQDDLWTFQCSSSDATDCAWTQVTKSSPWPPARSDATFTWDPSRHVAVLFGGQTFGDVAHDGVQDDTWEWTGSEWTGGATGGPPARYGHGAAYDPVNQRLLLFGGLLGDTNAVDGTLWKYADGSSPGTPDGGSSSGGSDGGSPTSGADAGSSGSTGTTGGTGNDSSSSKPPHGRYGCQTFPPAAALASLLALLAGRRRRQT